MCKHSFQFKLLGANIGDFIKTILIMSLHYFILRCNFHRSSYLKYKFSRNKTFSGICSSTWNRTVLKTKNIYKSYSFGLEIVASRNPQQAIIIWCGFWSYFFFLSFLTIHGIYKCFTYINLARKICNQMIPVPFQFHRTN